MRQIPFKKEYFFANYFWSIKDGYPIAEDILVKKYLENYFTFGDIVALYFLVGKDSLLKYSKELNMKKRVLKLINRVEAGNLRVKCQKNFQKLPSQNKREKVSGFNL